MTEKQLRILEWVADHRGVLTVIASKVRPKVSPQFVHMVLRGERKSRNGAIERWLKKSGAPI